GKREAAVRTIQSCQDQNKQRIESEFASLNDQLSQQLEKVGIEYLFNDYLDSWTRKANVPMPQAFVNMMDGK
ncbi:MAG: hypothetical protein ACOC7K_01135, partial [bacterium]